MALHVSEKKKKVFFNENKLKKSFLSRNKLNKSLFPEIQNYVAADWPTGKKKR